MIGETALLALALLIPGAVVENVPAGADQAFRQSAGVAGSDIGFDDAGYFQLVVRRQLIIRIPAQPSSLTNFSANDARTSKRSPQTPVVWKESKAPKCVEMRSLIGIQAVQRDSIDLITRENQRLRAKLNRGCRALDFYSGFYLKASKDGRLCADRDALHARSGAECEVAKFRLMVPIRQES